MKPVKFNDTNEYQFMNIFGVEGVLSERRIERSTLPEGFYKYSLSKGGEEYIGAISNELSANHAADFITKEPISLGSSGTKALNTQDWSFVDKDFDFESYFGSKLSIDLKIELAIAKRDELMGLAPKDRGLAKPQHQHNTPAL